MMRTLRDMNMSKFVAEDVPLFISLIEDLFPSQKAERAHFPDISRALDKVCLLCRFQAIPKSILTHIGTQLGKILNMKHVFVFLLRDRLWQKKIFNLIRIG